MRGLEDLDNDPAVLRRRNAGSRVLFLRRSEVDSSDEEDDEEEDHGPCDSYEGMDEDELSD